MAADQHQPHPLLRLFLDAADGRFPPADGGVTVLGPLPRGLECSVAFTGHAVIATSLPPEEVDELEPDGFGGSLTPDVLRGLAGPDGAIGCVDATLTARGTGGPPRLHERTGLEDHPRVRLALELRTRVRTFGDDRGLVTLADGLAGRRELSVELNDPAQSGGHGTGRSLIRDALTLVPAGEPVFAAVSPGNARSLRAFLAADFTPIASESVLRPSRTPRVRVPPAADLEELRHRAVHVHDLYDELNRLERGRVWTREEFMLGFTGDVGDLAKLVMAEEGAREVRGGRGALEHELADCLWSVLILAHRYGVPLAEAYHRTMDELDSDIGARIAAAEHAHDR
ncbi:nucleoside triphosphate pyrophosphohydrolase family protein [Streptomyces winkii]|uniref:hypothetical protein n=1 Tax=Streptomyces winkii TaxID=3051178 RepID=UPI0028D8B507|nr:hypothetical protein [Streptomyces sp. DSM 40971]